MIRKNFELIALIFFICANIYIITHTYIYIRLKLFPNLLTIYIPYVNYYVIFTSVLNNEFS